MAPITAPTTEIGYTQTPNYNWWLYENETTPELIWPMSVYVYDQMRRQDAQVGSVLRAVTETLLRTPWRIDPAGARARVVKFVADDLGLPVVGKQPTAPPRLKDRFSWPTHLREALLMLPMGHSYFEQVYRVAADGSAAHLRKLAYRPAKTIERIDVAPDGGLIAIKQWWTTADRRPEPIPVNRLVAYIHAKEGGNWLGTSILRNCYKNWLLKDRLLRVQAQTIERNGMGIPLYTANESETDLSAGLSMATKWRAGEAAGSAIPFGASLKLVGVEGTLPDAEPAIRYHDEQIARAVLAHFLNLGTQTGSWALGSTFADFFVMSLQTLAEQIRDTATSHIIEDLVDINFGENEPAPRLVFDEIGSRQAATAIALKTLVDAGVIRPDEVLEESSRQQYGLPPADPATVRTPPPASASTLPPVDQPSMGDGSVAASRLEVNAGRHSIEEELRDPHSGEWIHGPGSVEKAGKDALKLADRIQLGNDEKLVSSGKLTTSTHDHDIALAAIDGPHGREYRVGVVLGGDAEKWTGANKGGTVRLDDAGLNALAAAVNESSVKGKKRAKEVDKAWEAGHGATAGTDNTYLSGVVEGEWGNLVYHANTTDDDPAEWQLHIAVKPDNAPANWDEAHDGATLDPSDIRKLSKLLASRPVAAAEEPMDDMPPSQDEVRAAAGMDTHPGGEQLKHYWLHGDGAAKWSTWTELRDHLLKYLNPEMAKRTAAEWFHLRYGFWPGADVNRVKHGKPPRGHVVGPG